MKKLLAILTAMVMTASLAACGSSTTDTTAKSEETTKETAAETTTEEATTTEEETTTEEAVTTETEDSQTDIEDTVVYEDDWVNITFKDITCVDDEADGTLVITNLSGKELLLSNDFRIDNGQGEVDEETNEITFADASEQVLASEYYHEGDAEYTVFVFDPSDLSVNDMGEDGEYVYRKGRRYDFSLSVSDGQVVPNVICTETSEFAYVQ